MTDLHLPWPPRQLTPNARRRQHWTANRRFVQSYRIKCGWIATEWLRANALSRNAGLRMVSVTFYPPDRRRRDDDGMIGAFKAGRDGVADALGVDDHTFRPAYHFAEPVRDGRIVVVMGEVAA